MSSNEFRDYKNKALVELQEEIVKSSEKEIKDARIKYVSESTSKTPPKESAFQESINVEKIRAAKADNDSKETDLGLKKGICFWVKCVVSIYLAFIAVVVANIVFWKEGGLSDAVLIALLTTTTINILGLPLMIILSLFPNKKKLREQQKHQKNLT